MAEAINTAFASDATLRKRIFDAINETPQHTALFEDIARFHLASRQFSVIRAGHDEATEQPVKKRKLEEGAAAANGALANQPRNVILEARDISFSLPQRKKLHLNIIQYGQDFNAPNTTFAVCGRNPANNQVEFEHSLATFAYVLRVAVPEKAQKQYNFCLLPSTQAQSFIPAGEPVIWTVNHGPLKSCQINSEPLQKLAPGPEDVLESTLNATLQHSDNKLVYPNDTEFVSTIVEAHRKNDKVYHVKAFRGSKDGFLYFLENGIFFGFKKPLAFFPFHEIESISYTAVLQRTFNLIIVIRSGDDAQEQELEFSMLDQADFAGIDAYLKRHQLQDASMAEARRAKKLNINSAKGDVSNPDDNDGRTELEKAEEEMEDEEDELEEDYDPGSDGESEGSGSSDEDDYEDAGDADRKDLVTDELGSEAEDVEIDEEDDDLEEVDQEEVENPAHTAVETKAVPRSQPFQPISRAQLSGPDLNDEDQL